MAIELKQQLRLSQQLVMTPQLQQAIKLLQLSRLELLTTVQLELEQNPLLEEGLELEELPSEVADDEILGAASESETPAEGSDREANEEADRLSDIDWERYRDAPSGASMAPIRDDDERPGFEATATRRETLQDHLQWQLQLSSAFDDAERVAANWLVGNLDEDGFLRATVEDVARQSGVEAAVVEASLAKLQHCDPPGVAARDLRECLLLQLDALHVRDALVRRIVDLHITQLQKRDLRGIARETGATIEEVAIAADAIAALEPRPGRNFGGDDTIYITPDIYVYKVGEDFHIVLNEDGLPKLRINALYRDVLARSRKVEKDTRDYVQEKVRAAMWLIKSIHQRQRTIYKVMESIVRYQREFFEKGVSCLRPLNLRDVADDIGMHESTVSRVTTNKYAHTPQGIFELKYFFNSSINRVNGDAMASESVKERIRKIIASEDTRRPLSDQRIAEMLRTANIDIARRTVTKYREAMNILSSTQRRRVG